MADEKKDINPSNYDVHKSGTTVTQDGRIDGENKGGRKGGARTESRGGCP